MSSDITIPKDFPENKEFIDEHTEWFISVLSLAAKSEVDFNEEELELVEKIYHDAMTHGFEHGIEYANEYLEGYEQIGELRKNGS